MAALCKIGAMGRLLIGAGVLMVAGGLLVEFGVPLGRLGRSDDIARAVLWLLSEASEYITGEEILVDGGVTISVIAGLPRPQSVDAVGVKPGVTAATNPSSNKEGTR